MSKKPFVTKEQVEEIVKTYPTPFHLYDEKGIRENAKALKEAFAWNPGYKEYFAVKATPNPFLLQILKEYGCGCDCSSYTELLMSDAVGIDGHDIMFSSNDTPEEDFKLADKLGAIINLDDITHIDFLEKTIGHIPETISCRYNPGGIFKISNDIMDNPGDSKYGMTTEQITEAFKTLKAKGAKEFGIHAFLASNTVTNDYYPMLAKVLFEQAVRLQKETGVHIKFINLSGGIGIPYTPDQEPNDIRVIGEGVRKVYEEVLVPAGMGDVAIYTELGRFMMGPYGCLVTKAIHEKHTHKEYIGVDACAVNLMRQLVEVVVNPLHRHHGLVALVYGQRLVLNALGGHVNFGQRAYLRQYGVVGRGGLPLCRHDLDLRVKRRQERRNEVVEAVEHAQRDDQRGRGYGHAHRAYAAYQVDYVRAFL